MNEESREIMLILIFSFEVFQDPSGEGVQPGVQFLRQLLHPWVQQGLHVIELVVAE